MDDGGVVRVAGVLRAATCCGLKQAQLGTFQERSGVFKVTDVKPLPGYKLRLRYSDGVEGVVDLSHLVGKGVFAVWDRAGVFEDVSIGTSGEIRWGDAVDLCPDALYMELTGKSPEEISQT